MSMTVTCPSCSESFPVDPAKIPAGGIKARCSSCQGIIDIAPPEAAPADEGPGGGITEPVADVADPAPAPEAPAPPEEVTPPEEVPSPMGGDAVIDSDLGTEGTDAFGEREISFDGPPATPDEAEGTGDADADSVFASVSDDEADTPQAAPIQFGKRSPEDKAKSLARSLVSDIIAYHKEKHAQAKASGDLPQVFEEEVDKCWKEYQEQVDPGVVQNNRFFNDALNDILADGQPVFNMPG